MIFVPLHYSDRFRASQFVGMQMYNNQREELSRFVTQVVFVKGSFCRVRGRFTVEFFGGSRFFENRYRHVQGLD